MTFSLFLPQSTVIVQEPIPVVLRFRNGEANTSFPWDYQQADVVTVRVFDADGTLVGEADGYDRLARANPRVRRWPQDQLDTFALDPGDVVEWEEDLLTFVAIPEPGTYTVEADFRFEPAGAALTTEPATLTVQPNRTAGFDLLRNQGAMDIALLVQQHRQDGEAQALVHLRSAATPARPWIGSTLDVPAGAAPRIGELAFARTDTFAHDLTRWVAWIDGTDLQVTTLTRDEPSDTTATIGLGTDQAELIGRPFQHEDGSATILLLKPHGDAYVVQRLDVSAAFEVTEREEVLTLGSRPGPITAASDWTGRVHLLYGRAGTLPVQLLELSPEAGRYEHRMPLYAIHFPDLAIDELRSLRVLDLRADIGLHVAARRALLAAIVFEQKDRRIFRWVRVGLFERKGTLRPDPDDVDMTPLDVTDAWPADDELVGADVVQDARGGLHALVHLASGRVFYLRPGAAPRELSDVAADPAPQLFPALGGDVYLFAPTAEAGVQAQVLHRAPRR